MEQNANVSHLVIDKTQTTFVSPKKMPLYSPYIAHYFSPGPVGLFVKSSALFMEQGVVWDVA